MSAVRLWPRVHARLLAAGWRRGARYRAAALGGLVANATFGFLKASILVAAVRAGGGQLGGYDAASITACTWSSQALLGPRTCRGPSPAPTPPTRAGSPWRGRSPSPSTTPSCSPTPSSAPE